MKPSLKSIKINADNYPTIVSDIYQDGADFKDGKFEGTKSVGDELQAAINALMQLVHDVCHLGDDWLDELGRNSRVSGVVLKDDGLVLTAQLKRDYGQGVKAIVVNTPFVKYDELDKPQDSALDELRKQVQIYLDTLPVQGDLLQEMKVSEAVVA